MTIYFWNDDEKVTCILDSERKNRYLLNCSWDAGKPSVTYIMFNPSEGNELVADATLRRSANFAKRWGYGSMNVVNLFSQISKNPKDVAIPSLSEKVRNERYIMKAVSDSECVIFSWGKLVKDHQDMVEEVTKLVPAEKQFCIKKTEDGLYPRHPLFLPKNYKPIPW
ncbi:DUF1643 domain-containing protein [Anaerobacillus sp. MEB173]|uniref:DUF1643 domain-containing protein n=1 Tax=Anaerobacillus sp. MEB173 TaxID=3383345 RepID=UPI003F8F8E35